MANTRGRTSRGMTPEEPEPSTAQLLTFLIRQSEDQRLQREREMEEKRAEWEERRAEREEKRAEREQKRAEKLARREEEARRANAPRPGTVDSFYKLHPPAFYGTESALAAEDWVKEIGKFLIAARIPEEEKVPIATLQLKGNAQIWWEAELPKYQSLGVDPTWAQFSTCFLKKFFPATQEALMKARFANLVQGSMSVDEYTAEFTRLSRFCPVIAASATEMMEKFRQGLRQEIQDDFAILDLTTFEAVLETARKVELVHQRRRSAAQSALARRTVPLQQQQQTLRQQLAPRPQPQRFQPAQRGVAQAQPGGQQPGRTVVCNFCHRPGHFQRECRKANGLCLRCGSPDHTIATCPQRAPAPQMPTAPAAPAAGQLRLPPPVPQRQPPPQQQP